MQIGITFTAQLRGPDGADLEAIVARAERAEELGFDFACVGHHRFTPGYEADPWLLLAAIAGRTSTLRLGTAIFLLPLDHPLDVAEHVATLDRLSNGRAFLGAGLGYRPYEYETLGLDFERRGSRMSECLDVVQRAWTEEQITFEGDHFTFADVTVLPRPVQSPRPPVWVGANSRAGVDRAARLADGWIVGFADRLSDLEPRIGRYRQQATTSERRSGVCLMRLVGVGADRQAVEETWLPRTVDALRSYRRAGAPGARDEQTSSRARTGRLALDDVGDEMFVAGTPDDVVRGLQRSRAVTGCDALLVALGGPDERDPDAALELFGREVIPALRS